MFQPVRSLPSRRVRAALLVACATGLAAVAPAAASADTALTTCDVATFDAAAAAGGVVRFDVDCSNIVFDKLITVAKGTTLDIEANGHFVTLNGGNHRRLFTSNGTLIVRGT